MAVSREAFDAELVRCAIRRGADFLPMTRATGLAAGAERRLILSHAAGQVEVSAGVVLAADGLGGSFLSKGGIACPSSPGARIGASTTTDTTDPFYRPNVIFMTCGATGYAGLVRVEDGRLDVACALEPGAVRAAGGPGTVVHDLLRAADWPVPTNLAESHWRGTPALTRQARRVAGHRLFALGDATGYVEPFTGEGMAWAISSAVALAGLAAQPWRPELATAWSRLHRQIVTRRQWPCRAAAFVLRRPALAGGLISLLSWLPSLAGPVVRYLNDCPPTSRELG